MDYKKCILVKFVNSEIKPERALQNNCSWIFKGLNLISFVLIQSQYLCNVCLHHAIINVHSYENISGQR